MVALVLIATGVLALAALVALGWVPDTREPGRRWYPAAPDPEPACPGSLDSEVGSGIQ